MSELIVFPDAEAWATGFIHAALAGRSEPFAQGVDVGIDVPDVMPSRLVTVRRDGGPRLDVVRESVRLSVRVWADSEADASDLAALVRALLEVSADGAPVLRVRATSGPVRVNKATEKPLRFMSLDFVIRGAAA